MLESNSPRDNRCDSSRTMGKGVAFGRALYDESSRPTNGRQHPPLNLGWFSAPIGPIDRPCLGKLNRAPQTDFPADVKPSCAGRRPNVLPMSQERTVTHVSGPDSRKFGAGDGIRTRDIDLGKVALYQLSYSRSGEKPHFRPEHSGCQTLLLSISR